MTMSWRSLGVGIGAAIAVAAATGCSGSEGSGTNEGASTAAPGQGGATGVTGAGTPGVAATGNTIFAVAYGDEGQQSMGGLGVGPAGEVYVVGQENTTGVATFGPSGRVFGPQEGSANGAFAVKYGPTGQLEWRQPFPAVDPSSAALIGAAVQPTTGAVIVAGWVEGDVDTGAGVVSSGTDPRFGTRTRNAWLTALDASGYVVWSRLYPSQFLAEPSAVFVTASGDIELVGRASDNATVGGAPLCCRNTEIGTNTFLARFSPTGDPIWSEAVIGGFQMLGAGGDPSGGLVLGGFLSGTMTFDGETLTGGPQTNPGLLQTEGVVLRIDPQGHRVWTKLYTNPGAAQTGATLDPAGNVILFGQFNGDLDLGNGQRLSFPTDNPYESAGLVARLAPDGTAQWARSFPQSGFAQTAPVAAAGDAAGNVEIVGETGGGVGLGGTPPLPAGAAGDFVAKYAPDGAFLWSRGFVIDHSIFGGHRMGLAFDPGGSSAFGGEFDNTVDFGTGPLTAPGQPSTDSSALPKVPDNVFAVKLAP